MAITQFCIIFYEPSWLPNLFTLISKEYAYYCFQIMMMTSVFLINIFWGCQMNCNIFLNLRWCNNASPTWWNIFIQWMSHLLYVGNSKRYMEYIFTKLQDDSGYCLKTIFIDYYDVFITDNHIMPSTVPIPDKCMRKPNLSMFS